MLSECTSPSMGRDAAVAPVSAAAQVLPVPAHVPVAPAHSANATGRWRCYDVLFHWMHGMLHVLFAERICLLQQLLDCHKNVTGTDACCVEQLLRLSRARHHGDGKLDHTYGQRLLKRT